MNYKSNVLKKLIFHENANTLMTFIYHLCRWTKANHFVAQAAPLDLRKIGKNVAEGSLAGAACLQNNVLNDSITVMMVWPVQ